MPEKAAETPYKRLPKRDLGLPLPPTTRMVGHDYVVRPDGRINWIRGGGWTGLIQWDPEGQTYRLHFDGLSGLNASRTVVLEADPVQIREQAYSQLARTQQALNVAIHEKERLCALADDLERGDL